MIEVQSLTRRYGPLVAVDDLSFSVADGEVLGFLGPNGAGKTTTMRILTGSLGATSGSVSVAGHDVRTESKQARRQIGYLPESPRLYVGMVVRDYLDHTARLRRVGRGERSAAVERAIAKTGLGDVAGAIRIQATSLEGSRAVRDRLRATLGPNVRVTDWRERNRNLFSALKLEKIAMFLVLTINILLAAFSITSTLVMTIIERKREVAILSAMGSSRAGVVRIFTSQGAFTGLVGALLGTAIGLVGGYVLSVVPLPLDPNVYYISAIPVDVRWVDVVAINVVALLVSLVSTVYPAWYAASLRPVEGLSG